MFDGLGTRFDVSFASIGMVRWKLHGIAKKLSGKVVRDGIFSNSCERNKCFTADNVADFDVSILLGQTFFFFF